VTEEYTNLEAQLRNLEATETELLALLTEVRENRGKAEEILAIYDKLTQIRSQIEQLKGRQQYLATMSAMATITVEVQPKAAPVSPTTEVEWSPLVTLSRAWRALLVALKGLYNVLVYLVLLSPIVLIPVGLVWGLLRLLRRGKRSKKA
jgi:hypothetical protein